MTHSCPNCTPEMLKKREGRNAVPCQVCGGYYPGDCKCLDCCCDGCNDWETMQKKHDQELEDYLDDWDVMPEYFEG